ncbi:MAG: RNA 3'-terminal phosphate cyclase [Gammaproteobacteria bacterium]|nr:RNA 3'-terminal phosphate cyclase [Gammaproteobacteria bacterium]
MITINGAEGEGGGQIVRNACALSLVTGKPFKVFQIRGRRDKPGLMRQHVTAVTAAQTICGGHCEGLAVGSTELAFEPGMITPGEYHFAVGTAGSTALVLQTVLLPLAMASGPSRLILDGGTHNMMAPPFDFISRTFLPQINRMGPRIEARLLRHGFYPRGGGRIEVDIQPAALTPIDCIQRGQLLARSARVIYAGLPANVAKRLLMATRESLAQWPEDSTTVEQLPGDRGPGVILLLEAAFENVTEVVSGFGQRGARSEQLAAKSAARMTGYLASDAFAGPYLADQLILPLSLAGGGSFTTVKPSQHTLTAADITARFTGRPVIVEQLPTGVHLVSIGQSRSCGMNHS